MILGIPEDKEYFSIGEVSRLTGVETHVLRYWESQFGALRPARRTSGHRKFTRPNIETILRIKELLYEKRFTIEGAKKTLRKAQKKGAEQVPLEFEESTAAVNTLKVVKKEIKDLLTALKKTEYTSLT